MCKTRLWLLIMTAGIVCGRSLTDGADAGSAILDRIDTKRGICVVLGDAKCELAMELAKQTELLIYVQMPNSGDVQAARRIADDAGLYGTRIFVEEGPLTHLHLADNIADVAVALGPETAVSQAEVLRVLRPQGRALGRRGRKRRR